MKKLLFILSFIVSVSAFAQPAAPVVNKQDVYITKATISWTKPATATTFELQRATASDFTGATVVYTGGNQFYDDAALTGNTQYYYRVRASADGVTYGAWASVALKTLYSPTAASLGGNRFATSADAVTYAGCNVNVGDYIVVGNTSGGNGGDYGTGVLVGSSAGNFNSDTNKIVFLGGRGYDWVYLNMDGNWSGTDAAHERIVTNGCGQVVVNNFEMVNARYVRHTGKYDAVKKTGDANYIGFDAANWNNLNGSFGWFFRGKYTNRNSFGYHLAGDCKNVTLEYQEGGEGNYVAFSIKNDGWPIEYPSTNRFNPLPLPDSTGGAWKTVTVTNVNLSSSTSTIRILGNGGTTFSCNWIEFVGAQTYRIEAENYAGASGVSVQPTSDVGGGSELYLIDATSDYADYNITIPKGTYTVNVRVKTTAATSTIIRQGSAPFDSLTIRYSYFKDTWAGENGYIGSTQVDPQQPITNFEIYDNIFARAGLNGIQIGQIMGNGSRFHNNTMISVGTSWSETFQRYQDQTIQQSTRAGGFTWDKNIHAGGGESFINDFIIAKSGYSSASSVQTFKNNLFRGLLGQSGGYIHTKDPSGITVNIDSNIFAKSRVGGGRYAVLYPWTSGVLDYVISFEASTGIGTMNARGNQYDATWNTGATFIKKFGTVASLTTTESGNVQSTTISNPAFNNYMDLPVGYDYASIESWTPSLSPQWNQWNTTNTAALNGNSTTSLAIPTTHPTSISLTVSSDMEANRTYAVGEYIIVHSDIYTFGAPYIVAQVTSHSGGVVAANTVANYGTGTDSTWRISKARMYNINDYVLYNNRVYKSLINNNTGNRPSNGGDANWQLIVFSNGSLHPIDDVRLPANDYYKQRGIGLSASVASQVQAYFFKKQARHKRGSLKPKKF